MAKSQQATSRCTCEKVPVLAGHGHASRVGQPGPPKFFTTSALNAEAELTWHADFILALAQYGVSRLAYIIFLRVAGVGSSLGIGDTVEPKELAAVGCQVNLSSWRMEWRCQPLCRWSFQVTCKLGKSILEPKVSLVSEIQG